MNFSCDISFVFIWMEGEGGFRLPFKEVGHSNTGSASALPDTNRVKFEK